MSGKLLKMYFRQPDIQVPYLYFDMAAAVLCASFMSFGVKRRWFALGAALQLALSTYASYIGGHVHYGDWLKVRTNSEAHQIVKCSLNWPFDLFTYACLFLCIVSFACSLGEDVLEGHGCYRSFSSAGQWSRRSVQAETTHTLTTVHWPSLLRNLLNLSGKLFLHRYPPFLCYFLFVASTSYALTEKVQERNAAKLIGRIFIKFGYVSGSPA